MGLLAEVFLKREKGARIGHDPRLTWNTLDIVANYGGKAVLSKSGHAFIKQVMRDCDGAYGGEMSAHHYFRDFAYCDSGMIPWLLVAGLMSASGKPLSALVAERAAKFPCSGEINNRVSDPRALLAEIEARYRDSAAVVDFTDGPSTDNNLRAAYLHVLADALTSVLAIIALVAGKYANWVWLDPAMGIVGAIVIARWSWSLMRDTAGVLLDTADPHLVDEIRQEVEGPGDSWIADLHVWRIGPDAHAAVLTVATSPSVDISTIRERLKPVHELVHVTVERHVVTV